MCELKISTQFFANYRTLIDLECYKMNNYKMQRFQIAIIGCCNFIDTFYFVKSKNYFRYTCERPMATIDFHFIHILVTYITMRSSLNVDVGVDEKLRI